MNSNSILSLKNQTLKNIYLEEGFCENPSINPILYSINLKRANQFKLNLKDFFQLLQLKKNLSKNFFNKTVVFCLVKQNKLMFQLIIGKR